MARRFRPRFSVRTLAIFVTLACAYFGAWEATKRYGVTTGDEARSFTNSTGHRFSLGGPANESSPMPFLIRRDSGGFTLGPGPFAKPTPRYYLWLFGPRFKVYGDPRWKEFSELSEFPNP